MLCSLLIYIATIFIVRGSLIHTGSGISFFRDQFKPTTTLMTPRTKQNWPYLTLDEKLLFLFIDGDIERMLVEFKSFFDGTAGDNDRISFRQYKIRGLEYQDEIVLKEAFQECDLDKSSDLDFREFFLCRCEFSMYGTRNTVNEIDARVAIMMQDYDDEQHSSKLLKQYQYDENGIIID